jgi:hypothetical protein
VLKRAPNVPHELQAVRSLVLHPVHHLLLLHPKILNYNESRLTNAFRKGREIVADDILIECVANNPIFLS